MPSLTWTDPRTDDLDQPAWAIWETECGTYRITWTPAGFLPSRKRVRVIHATTRHIDWVPLGIRESSLEGAYDAVNAAHCRDNDLVLVR